MLQSIKLQKSALYFCLGVILVLTFSVLLPRLAALGDFLHMDEGYHDFMSRYIQQAYVRGEGFPSDFIGYKLYNFLFFWVYYLPGNGTIWLRGMDLLIALACGIVFCLMLCRESGSRWAGLLLCLGFFTGLNLPFAIDSGFKNSFFPAFLCLFTAVLVAGDGRRRAWFWAGALTAIGVLFRETFFPFAVIGCISLLINRNYGALARYIAGGVAAAALISLLLMLVRGQVWGIFEFYFIYGKIYGPEAARRWFKFCQNGGRAAFYFSPLLLLTLASLYMCLRQRKINFHDRGAFWLMCALAPLLEPLSKIGFLYHFSACLPGMAGFCAYCFAQQRQGRKYWLGLMAACAVLMQPLLWDHYQKLPTTLETLRSWPKDGWPEPLAAQSTTLQAAGRIEEIAGPDATVGSSGFAYFIYPASGRLPTEMALSDLSRTYIYSGYDPAVFRRKLDANPPDIALIAATQEDHSATFEKELREIFRDHPSYEYMGAVLPNSELDHGWLGYHIYRKKLQGAPEQTAGHVK